MEKIEKIERVNTYSHPLFSEKVLKQHGAFLVNGTQPYEVEIVSKTDAIIRGACVDFYEKIIEEFRFFSEHITRFLDKEGNLVKEFPKVEVFRVPIEKIQPSQFYVDATKMEAVSSFIMTEQDVVIPLGKSETGYISLDGHTRLKVALEKGFTHVYGFLTEVEEYVAWFVAEAKKRGVTSAAQMEKLSHEEYEIKWNGFCDAFFAEEE